MANFGPSLCSLGPRRPAQRAPTRAAYDLKCLYRPEKSPCAAHLSPRARCTVGSHQTVQNACSLDKKKWSPNPRGIWLLSTRKKRTGDGGGSPRAGWRRLWAALGGGGARARAEASQAGQRPGAAERRRAQGGSGAGQPEGDAAARRSQGGGARRRHRRKAVTGRARQRPSAGWRRPHRPHRRRPRAAALYTGDGARNIPSVLSGVKGLEILDLSSNNFSGQIPKFLGDFSALYDLNLSFNNFDGEVPTVGVFANATGISVQGNGKLCGGIQDLHLPPCSLQISKKRHKFPMLTIVVSLVATTICILSLLLFFLTRHKKRSRESPSTMSIRGHQLVSYQQLAHATNGFSATNLLGNGSYGFVYRGQLYDETGENENLVAVKVLKLQTPGALKSFTAECEAMRNLRHRNLVKIITACSSIDFNGNDFKAIVFDFMPNGSLEEWLHPNTNNQREERHLSLVQRVNILFDVAYALDYLHFHGAAPIVHCDLKPSNVLLDVDMVAHVGDFGLARILAEGCSSFQPSTSSMGFRGTIGYAPPEYGAGNMVSTHGDIYSYGVLSLEMVTGKRPTDNTFEQGLSLRKYVDMALNSGVMDIIDPELVTELENGPANVDGPSNRRKFDSLISLLKLGMFCSEEMPSSRMSTKDIIKELHAIKEALD